MKAYFSLGCPVCSSGSPAACRYVGHLRDLFILHFANFLALDGTTKVPDPPRHNDLPSVWPFDVSEPMHSLVLGVELYLALVYYNLHNKSKPTFQRSIIVHYSLYSVRLAVAPPRCDRLVDGRRVQPRVRGLDTFPEVGASPPLPPCSVFQLRCNPPKNGDDCIACHPLRKYLPSQVQIGDGTVTWSRSGLTGGVSKW